VLCRVARGATCPAPNVSPAAYSCSLCFIRPRCAPDNNVAFG
jgi:hypothetical protein